MNLYFKILVAVFFTVLSYTCLTYFFGEKGVLAQKSLTEQINELKVHVSKLQEKEIGLQNQLLNLSYDYDTILVYANKLGYINEGEEVVKVLNMNGKTNVDISPGQYLTLAPISFVSDTLIKTLSASVGIIVILIELIFSYKNMRRVNK